MRRHFLRQNPCASRSASRSRRWAASASIAVTVVGCIALKDGNGRAPDDHDASPPDAPPAEQLDGLADQSAVATSNDATDIEEDIEESMADGRETTPPSDAGEETTFDALDGPEGSGRPQDGPPTDAALSPLFVDTTHLRLWLTADRGVTCASGRVSRWADQSGARNDATLQQGQLGPQCQVSQGPHLINGVDVPYFSAPPSATKPNVIDETLDVDLGFLLGNHYSIFVVERRLSDYDAGSGTGEEILLGTTVADETNPTCVPNSALAFGYVYYNGPVQLVLEQNCNATGVTVHGVPPTVVKQDTAVYDSWGHGLWVNGALLVVNSSLDALSHTSNGAIGRGIAETTAGGTDWRFRGDIAEVVIYDSGLSEVDRMSVEAYLKNHWRYE